MNEYSMATLVNPNKVLSVFNYFTLESSWSIWEHAKYFGILLSTANTSKNGLNLWSVPLKWSPIYRISRWCILLYYFSVEMLQLFITISIIPVGTGWQNGILLFCPGSSCCQWWPRQQQECNESLLLLKMNKTEQVVFFVKPQHSPVWSKCSYIIIYSM